MIQMVLIFGIALNFFLLERLLPASKKGFDKGVLAPLDHHPTD